MFRFSIRDVAAWIVLAFFILVFLAVVFPTFPIDFDAPPPRPQPPPAISD
jgi:hypothetical protein